MNMNNEIKNRILRMLVKRTGRPEYFTEMFLKEPTSKKWYRLVMAYCAKGNKAELTRVMDGYAGGPHDLTEVITVTEPKTVEPVAAEAAAKEAETAAKEATEAAAKEAAEAAKEAAEAAETPAEAAKEAAEATEVPAEAAEAPAKKRKTTKK